MGRAGKIHYLVLTQSEKASRNSRNHQHAYIGSTDKPSMLSLAAYASAHVLRLGSYEDIREIPVSTVSYPSYTPLISSSGDQHPLTLTCSSSSQESVLPQSRFTLLRLEPSLSSLRLLLYLAFMTSRFTGRARKKSHKLRE